MAQPYDAVRQMDGSVRRVTPLVQIAAIARRQAGFDVVVCGPDKRENRNVAEAIEAAVGPHKWHNYHRGAGTLGLPHWQQVSPPPAGHTFYEVDKRNATKP